ncbi:MAG: hybrid sensor histidine kinase/response regulator, partial [Chloroflexota bacterium]
DALKDVPVIFISALDDTNNIVKGFDVGGVDYINKPFKSREVLARVHTHVTIARQRKEIEALRQRERQQFERMDTLRSQFISSATHDLKNPLFVISGYTDMLEMNPDITGNKRVKGFIEAIQRGVEKMTDLVHDMLDLLQLETEVTLDTKREDLNTFLRYVIRDMKLRASEKDITLTLHPADEDIAVLMDTKRMMRVFENLLSNAIKYTQDGGTVDIHVLEAGDTVAIDVVDTGLGIPVDMVENLFQPFQRVNSEEHMAQEGTGLGLSIVKTLVEQHGGTVEVSSVLGEGSRFRVTLPVHEEKDTQ